MKKVVLLILLITTLGSYAQNSQAADEAQIKKVVNQFFEALEKRDTVLMMSVATPEGQVWRVLDDQMPERGDARFFRDDIKSLTTLPDVREVALGFDINIYRSIAMAWVPYEFYLEDQFSHCGIDVFTLFKLDGTWKIVCAAYSVQKNTCDDLPDAQ